MNAGTEAGAIPAKVAENIRPTVMAGLARLVEDVKKYAAPMYAPTAAGAVMLRPDRASAKITKEQAEGSDDLGQEMGGRGPVLPGYAHGGPGERRVRDHGPAGAPRDLRREVSGGVPPGQAAERGVGEGHHRVEMTARDGPEHQDDRVQAGRGRRRVLQQLQPGVAGGQALGGDARADYDHCQERASEQFRE
jgi:hypothetical protein